MPVCYHPHTTPNLSLPWLKWGKLFTLVGHNIHNFSVVENNILVVNRHKLGCLYLKLIYTHYRFVLKTICKMYYLTPPVDWFHPLCIHKTCLHYSYYYCLCHCLLIMLIKNIIIIKNNIPTEFLVGFL